MHHFVLDLMMMFSELRSVASRDLDDVTEDLTLWARYEILGLCHKVLRALDKPHFAACFLNPGVGHIPDLNAYLPLTDD